MVEALLPALTDNCPADLRLAISCWKDQEISNQELIDTAYSVTLDILSEYRAQSGPTVPDEVLEFREMGVKEKLSVSDRARDAFFRRNAPYLASEGHWKARMHGNLVHLRETLEWALKRNLDDKRVVELKVLIHQHEDLRTEPEQGDPFVVQDGAGEQATHPSAGRDV